MIPYAMSIPITMVFGILTSSITCILRCFTVWFTISRDVTFFRACISTESILEYIEFHHHHSASLPFLIEAVYAQ